MGSSQTSAPGEGFGDLQDEFLAEAGEHIEKVETRLLELEKTPDGVPDDRKASIAEVFRAIHSIKGAAGFMGFANISELSHVMETVLQMMRTGDIAPAPRIIDALLAGIDILRGLLDDLDSEGEMDIAPVRDRLTALIDDTSPDAAKTEMNTQVQVAGGGGEGFTVDQFTLNQVLQAHDHLYFLHYDLNELQSRSGTTPVALVRRLLERGAIVDTRIHTGAAALKDDLSATPLIYRVLYATEIGPDAVEAAVGLDRDRITAIDPSTLAPARGQNQNQNRNGDRADRSAPETLPPTETECTPPSNLAATAAASETPTGLHGCTETIRVKVDILDRLMELAGELVLVRNQQMISAEDAAAARSISQRLDIVTTELQETIMRTRMQPLGNVFAKLPRIVRDLSAKLDKEIAIAVSGSEEELDKTILETLTDPLIHLIRNCCDHGVEGPEGRKAAGKPREGRISVTAYHEAGQINLRIEDDGRGIDPGALKRAALARGLRTEADLARMTEKEILSLIFLPGFTTTETVSNVSGRGVGMDVVKSAMDALGGSVDIDAVQGKRTVIHLRLPLTLAIIPCLIVASGDQRYAIPQVNLVELVCLYDEDVFTRIERAEDQEVFRLRDRLLPMVRLAEALKRPEPFTRLVRREIADAHRPPPLDGDPAPESLHFAVVQFGTQRFGLIVDAVLGAEEIVVKPMHPALKSLAVYSGATVMGDGRVALILDVEGIARHAGIRFSGLRETREGPAAKTDETQTVLLFKSGEQERFAVTLPLIRRIEKIDPGRIETIGDKQYITIDGVSTMVLRMDDVLTVSPYAAAKEPFLLLPKHIKRPFGILVSSIVDIADAPLALNTDGYMADGLLGTAIIGDRTTLFIDVFRLIELAEPGWFAERRKLSPPPEVKKRVLLVEDTAFFRQLVKGYLESDGYNVTAAEDGKEALQYLNGGHYDLIVSDLEMPVMDGWRFMERVRNEPRWKTLPAVALTALDSEKDREAAREAGFDAYVIKIDREELLAKISKLIS